MPEAEDHDPEIASIWLRARIIEDAGIKAIIGQRAFDDVANLRGQALPLVYWDGQVINVANNYGNTNRIEWKMNIRGVWDSGITGPSRSPCRPLSKALKRVLCDTNPYRSEVPGVGWVHQCKFLSWYRPPARDEGDKRIIEHGITVSLITS